MSASRGQPITKEEFEAVRASRLHGGGRPVSAETVETLALKPLQGLRFPCRWKHQNDGCRGAQNLHQAGRRNNMRLRTTCKNGVLYIFRIEDREDKEEAKA